MRLFRCDDCGHHMRLSGSRCGKCYTPKRILQEPIALAGLAVIALGTLLAVILFVLLRIIGL